MWSREQALVLPAFGAIFGTPAPVDQPVMHAERAVGPEFDRYGRDAESRPVWRARHGADHMLCRGLGDSGFERKAAFQRARLRRGPGADLAVARPRGEIGDRKSTRLNSSH